MARHNLTTTTPAGVDLEYLDTLTTDAAPVFTAYADRSPAIRALACGTDLDHSVWSATWSRWDAARHRDQLGCSSGP